MGTLKKTARLWGFQSPGRPRTEAEHHTKQFLRQLPTRKPAGVIPTAQQTHPYISRRGGAGAGHSAALLSMRSCAPIPSEGRETGPRGRKSRGKKKIIQIIPSIQTKSSPDRWCGWFCAAHSCSVPASFFLLERGGF